MRTNQYADNKLIIKCLYCHSKMRVPLDKGKISVSCPTCRKEFNYNPNSILDTLKQIKISIISMISKHRR